MPNPTPLAPRRRPRPPHPARTALARRSDAAASPPSPGRFSPGARMAAIAVSGLTAATLFALLTARVRGQWTTPLDLATRRPLRRRMRGHGRSPARRAAHLGAIAVGSLGDTLAYVPAAAVGAWWLRRRGVAGGGPILGSAVTVALGRHVFRWMIPRFRPPTHLVQWNVFASYPSGHATGSMAVGLTAAHVLAHEGLVPPIPALAAALALTAAVGVARVASDEHWSTDIVGGWLAGAAVAAGATLVYEARR